MTLPLPAIFWLAIALAVASQVMILRSTVRAMRAAASAQARRGVEWAYAIVPAIALMVVLAATWQAARDYAAHVDLETRANATSTP